MNQHEQYPAVDDPELTVVTPHFTVHEARAARPVVPLSSSAAADATSLTASNESMRRRRLWSIPMIVISAVLGGVAGSLALNFFQGSQASPNNAPSVVSTPSPAAAAAATIPSVAITPASAVVPTLEPLATAQAESDAPGVSRTEAPTVGTAGAEVGSTSAPEAASKSSNAIRDKAVSREAAERAAGKAKNDQSAGAEATSGRPTEPAATVGATIGNEQRGNSSDRDNDSDQDGSDREDGRGVGRERRAERRRESAERRDLPTSPTPVEQPRQRPENQQQQQRIRDRINDIFEGRRGSTPPQQ